MPFPWPKTCGYDTDGNRGCVACLAHVDQGLQHSRTAWHDNRICCELKTEARHSKGSDCYLSIVLHRKILNSGSKKNQIDIQYRDILPLENDDDDDELTREVSHEVGELVKVSTRR